MALYQNKYRIESARLKDWDYSSNGAYYITICVKDRVCIFGNINNGKMVLSNMGQIAEQCWREIPNHFPFVQLDEFVIMPNHVHGIIIIKKSDNVAPTSSIIFMTTGITGTSGVFGTSVETQNFASLPATAPATAPATESEPVLSLVFQRSSQSASKYGPQSQNIGSIIRGFKIGVTKFAVNDHILFKWQPRFYDHIIRDENDLNRIRQYIKNNPQNWDEDDFYIRKKNYKRSVNQSRTY